MVLILYPPGINWFYEAFALSLHEELTGQGISSRLVIPIDFINQAGTGAFDGIEDVLIVNAIECAHSLGGSFAGAHVDEAMRQLRERLITFKRRVLLNLDGIHTTWFAAQMARVQGVATDIFDVCMVSQTDRPKLSGCRYTWIQESLTESERQRLLPHDSARPLDWSMIGHATRDRAEVAYLLMKNLSPSGLLFMPGLRPSYGEGSRNMSPEALDRVLQKTQYYVWTSHHRFPYHEGLRSLHALRNGAIPVKIDPLFAFVFRDVPWVYDSIAAFKTAVDTHGSQALYQRALDYILSRGTLGQHVAKALGNAGEIASVQEQVNRVMATL